MQFIEHSSFSENEFLQKLNLLMPKQWTVNIFKNVRVTQPTSLNSNRLTRLQKIKGCLDRSSSRSKLVDDKSQIQLEKRHQKKYSSSLLKSSTQGHDLQRTGSNWSKVKLTPVNLKPLTKEVLIQNKLTQYRNIRNSHNNTSSNISETAQLLNSKQKIHQIWLFYRNEHWHNTTTCIQLQQRQATHPPSHSQPDTFKKQEIKNSLKLL